MKQWLRPQVNVEKFVANEYVSACADYVIPTNLGTLVDTYADLNYSNTYNSGYEDIETNSGRYNVGTYGNTPAVGLYEHVNFYKEDGYFDPVNGDSYIEPFTQRFFSTHRFTFKGTYTVYVYRQYSGGSECWIYQDGYVPGGTPGHDKAFS